LTGHTEFALLAEIAGLVEKYGPDAFEHLAQKISSPEFSEALSSILSAFVRQARGEGLERRVGSPREQIPKSLRPSLVALEKTDPERSRLLLGFHDRLLGGRSLPRLRDIRTFVSDVGLPLINITSRQKAIAPLIKRLQALPLEELKSALSKVDSLAPASDRTLEGWSKIILTKGRSEK
jgi:hypothetical protein